MEKESVVNQSGRILMTRLNILIVVATTLYATLDKYLGIEVALYVYLGFYLFAIVNSLLIRYNRLEISKAFGLCAFNTMVFLIATSEPFNTGMHLHFVTAGAVALALYGYERWKSALLFVMLALVLDIITFTAGVSTIPWRDVEEGQANIFFILNTLITASVSIYVFMLSSKINYESQKSLQHNERTIKEQNDKLIKTNIELDRFVYSASHDLRAPLTSLTGLINLSKLESDENLKKEYLEMMNGRVKSMDEFISEIIDYSRNSRLELGKDEVDIKNLLENITDDLKYMEGRNKIFIHWDIDNTITMHSDLTRLKMVFTNLISNAIKYHDPEKTEPWIKLKGKKINNNVEISVEDNGIGINEDMAPLVFDMFYRAHEHSTGSGLGLYIAKETVDKLSGTMTLRSQVGKGSEFTVSLPVR